MRICLFINFLLCQYAFLHAFSPAPDYLLIQNGEWKWAPLLFGKSDSIDVRGEYRGRYEYLSGPFRKGNEPTEDMQYQSRARVRLAKKWGGHFQSLMELQDSRVAKSHHNGFANNNSVNTFDVQQLFVVVNNLSFSKSLLAHFHLGRLNLDLGRRRFIARNDFRNTSNAFDGAQLAINSQDNHFLWRAFAVKAVNRFMDELDPFWDGPNLYALSFEQKINDKFEWNPYFIYVKDHERSFGTFVLRWQKWRSLNDWDAEIEGAFQHGEKLKNNHSARFIHGEFGYTLGELKGTPQWQLLMDYASSGFDTLYGARRFDFNPTGMFGPFARSNIFSPGIRMNSYLNDKCRMMLKYREWYLAKKTSPWMGSGLSDSSGGAGNHLGGDFEIRLTFDFHQNLQMDAGYNYLITDSFRQHFKSVKHNPNADNSNYAYTQLRLRF